MGPVRVVRSGGGPGRGGPGWGRSWKKSEGGPGRCCPGWGQSRWGRSLWWGPGGSGLDGGGQGDGGPGEGQNFALFFSSPDPLFVFFFSICGFSWNCGGFQPFSTLKKCSQRTKD